MQRPDVLLDYKSLYQKVKIPRVPGADAVLEARPEYASSDNGI
jgi:hypothetical protein